MKFLRSSLLLLLVVCLVAVQANQGLRERFLSLRSRSSLLRKSTSATTSTTEVPTTSSKKDLISSSTTTAFPTLKEKMANKRPKLRFGLRPSSKGKISPLKSKKIEKKDPAKIKEIVNDELKKSDFVAPTARRGRFNLSLLNRRNKLLTNDHTELPKKMVELEEQGPKVIEVPALAVPLLRRPSITSHSKQTENLKINTNENVSKPKPISKFELKEDESVSKQQPTLLENLRLAPKEKIEPKQFSFKFKPSPNPLRNVVSDIQQQLIPIKKLDAQKPSILFPTKPVESTLTNHFDNYFEAERFPALTSDTDMLLTSETRTRSKIEIKEVNGTLYEYEYIYYYDDEQPLFDYDTPIISDYDVSLGPNNVVQSGKNEIEIVATQKENSLRKNHESSDINKLVQEPVLENRRSSRRRPEENIKDNLKVDEFILPARTRFPPRPTPPSTTTFVETAKIGLNEHLRTPLIPGDTGDRQEQLTFDPQITTEIEQAFTTTESISPTDTAAINLYALSKAVDADYDATTTVSPDNSDLETQAPLDYESFYDYDFTLSELKGFDIKTTTDLTTEEIPTTTYIATTTTAATTTPFARLRNREGSRLRGHTRGRIRVPPAETADIKMEDKSKVLPVPAKIPSSPRNRLARPRLRGKLRHGGRPSLVQTKEPDVKEPVSESIDTENVTETAAINSTTTASVRKPVRGGNLSSRRQNLRNRFRHRTRTQEKEVLKEEEKSKQKEVEPVIKKENMVTTEPAVRMAPASPRRPSHRRPKPRPNLLNRFNRGRKPKVEIKIEEKLLKEQDNINENATETADIPQAEPEPEEDFVTKDETTTITTTTITTVAPRQSNRRLPGRTHRFNLPNRFSKSRARARQNKATETKEKVDTTTEKSQPVATPEIKSNKEVTTPVTTVRSIHRFRGIRNRDRFGSRRRNPEPSRRLMTEAKKEQTIEVEKAPVLSHAIDETQKIIEPTPEVEVSAKDALTESTPRNQHTRGRSRFVPGQRTKSTRRLSALFGSPNLKESSSISKSDQEIESIKEIKTATEEVLLEESIVKVETETEVEGEPVVVEAAPEPEPEPVSEATIDETTTEKLTRRQILARRRSKFLG